MSDRFVRRSDVLSRSVGDELILASSGIDGIDRLSPTAALLWDELEKPRCLEEVAAELVKRYDASTEEIASDVRLLVEQLAVRGWVVRLPGQT